jgi:hypothetical protein
MEGRALELARVSKMTSDSETALEWEPRAFVVLEGSPHVRDMERDPYSPDETRVVRWLYSQAGICGGSDPIGFLIASYAYLVAVS